MRNKGFTLVELMVVVAIIIILAAILVPRYLDVTDQAKASKCLANQRTVEGAASVYMADNNGTLPSGTADLIGQYIPAAPTCPGTGALDFTQLSVDGSVSCSQHSRDY